MRFDVHTAVTMFLLTKKISEQMKQKYSGMLALVTYEPLCHGANKNTHFHPRCIKWLMTRPILSSKASQFQLVSSSISTTQSKCSPVHLPSYFQFSPSHPSSSLHQSPSHAVVVAAAAMALCNAATRPTRQAISRCFFPRQPLTSHLSIIGYRNQRQSTHWAVGNCRHHPHRRPSLGHQLFSYHRHRSW